MDDFEVGKKVRFKEDYITNSGIIISTRAVGTITNSHTVSMLVHEIRVDFDVSGIVFPIIKQFGQTESPNVLFELVK